MALSKDAEQSLRNHQSKAPRELVQAYEQVRESLMDFADIKDERETYKMYSQNVYGVVVKKVMESIDPIIEGMDFNGEKGYITNEDGAMVAMEMADVHKHNIEQLLENTGAQYRQNINPHNLNALTPFDGFVPHVIVRSYMPLVAKELMPFETPDQPFVRIRRDQKYVVTRTGEKFRRPDVFFDIEKADEILQTAKGRVVSQDWYPAMTESIPGSGKLDKFPDEVKLKDFDLLQVSGGNRQIGDALDIDICVDALKVAVGNDIVEVQVQCYPDLTSVSPQRSISCKIGPIKIGNTEVTDTLYGEYNGERSTFQLTSMNGFIKQVKFGGHLSNKNNTEYISYAADSSIETHPIPEGFTGNVPITGPDMQLYRQCANIDIIANAVNEITEMMTQLEDNSVVKTLSDKFTKYKTMQGKGQLPSFANFEQSPVVFSRDVDVQHDASRLLKRYEFIQDQINYALGRLVADVRDVLKAEPFKIKLYAHPNVASLFVGDNVDWKINVGTTVAEGVQSSYNKGIYTSDGNTFTLVTSQKFPEVYGIRFVVLPINEQNFLTWKHYKHSITFDNNHRVSEMPNVPAVHGVATFHTEGFIPFQGELKVLNYK